MLANGHAFPNLNSHSEGATLAETAQFCHVYFGPEPPPSQKQRIRTLPEHGRVSTTADLRAAGAVNRRPARNPATSNPATDTTPAAPRRHRSDPPRFRFRCQQHQPARPDRGIPCGWGVPEFVLTLTTRCCFGLQRERDRARAKRRILTRQ